jgi:hypothetical protein
MLLLAILASPLPFAVLHLERHSALTTRLAAGGAAADFFRAMPGPVGTPMPASSRLASSPGDSLGEHPAPAPALGLLRPVLGTAHFEMLQRAPGDSVYRIIGRVLVDRESEPVGTTVVLSNVVRYDWANGKVTIDTTRSLAGTLAPLSERTRTPSRIVAYDFHFLHTSGRIGPPEMPAAIEDTLPRPAFNSTDLDMLVTALPLHAGFDAAVPLYDPEFPGFRMAALRVTGTESIVTTIGTRQAWVLSVDQPSRPTMYYRIDMTTHAMLQKDFGAPDGPAFRIQVTGPGVG